MLKTLLFALITLTLTACNSIGFLSLPDALTTETNTSFKGKVLIIGAGAAGLSAANVLAENNIDYQILEATNRYGGRVQMDTTFADFSIDIGGEWIHNKKALLNRLKGSESDDVAEELILFQPMNVYNWDGESYKKTSKSKLKRGYSILKEYKFKDASWFQFLEENFAQKVKDKIVYNTIVTNINYAGNTIVVKTKDGKTYNADKVLVTVSLGVLQAEHITFEPAMPQQKIAAINSVELPKGFKLFMQFSEKFYPDMINCVSEVGEKTFYDVAYQKEAQDHVLGLLSTGSSAEEYYQLESKNAIVDSVLAELDNMLDGKASRYYKGEYLLKDWGHQPFTLGTWTTDYRNYKWLTAPLANKVYFAGETYDEVYSSTIHGAIISGNKVAKEILERDK